MRDRVTVSMRACARHASAVSQRAATTHDVEEEVTLLPKLSYVLLPLLWQAPGLGHAPVRCGVAVEARGSFATVSLEATSLALCARAVLPFHVWPFAPPSPAELPARRDRVAEISYAGT